VGRAWTAVARSLMRPSFAHALRHEISVEGPLREHYLVGLSRHGRPGPVGDRDRLAHIPLQYLRSGNELEAHATAKGRRKVTLPPKQALSGSARSLTNVAWRGRTCVAQARRRVDVGESSLSRPARLSMKQDPPFR
jgi:hypothetical protein